MADPTDKNPPNTIGPYYNDSTCIDCDICREIAPALFRRNDDLAMSYVWRQPETPEEHDLAEEALTSCPTESIGRDGNGDQRNQV